MQAFGSGCLDFSFERCWISISMLNRFADIWICLFGGELGIYMYRDEKHALFVSTPTIFLAPFACRSMLCRAGFCCAPYFLDLTSCSRPLT
jgi:hypothetical protein